MHSRRPEARRPQTDRARLRSLSARFVPVLRWLPAVVYMVANWVVSDTPGERLGPLPAPDWLLHAAAYAVFSLTLYLAMGPGRRQALAAAGIVAAYAALDEWHQSWVPGRSASLWDWLADVVGAGLGWSAVRWADGRLLQRHRRASAWVWVLGLLALLVSGAAAVLGASEPPRGRPSADAGRPVRDVLHLVQLHALLDEAERALASGDPAGARERLARMTVADADGSFAAFRYFTLRSRAALAAGAPPEGVAMARTAMRLAVEDDRLEARLLLADALEAAREYAEAFDVLADVAEDPGLLYRGLLRHRVLERLAGLADRLAPDTPESRARLLRYGRILYRFGRWQEGVALFSRPGWQEQQLQAVSELARGLGALGQRARQVSLLEQALDEAKRLGLPASRISSLRLQLAAAMQEAGRTSEAEALREAVLREDAGSAAAGDALSALVRAALDGGDVDGALAWVERYGAAATGTTGWREALWSLFAAVCGDRACEAEAESGPQDAPPEVGEGPRSTALRILARLDAGGAQDAAYLYWRARLEPDRRPALVSQLVRSQPLSYYAVLARERWPELVPEAPPTLSGSPTPPTGEASAERSAASPPDRSATSVSELAAIEALRLAGRSREALLELRYLLGAVDSRPSTDAEGATPALLAILARRETELGEYRSAIRHLNRLLQATSGTGASLGGPALGRVQESSFVPAPEPSPPWILRGLFPLAFEQVVRAEAAARDVDPLLVWAIMREESSFEPQAISLSDAYGLMQLIPSTARWMAQRVGAALGSPAELFDPALNVRLGTAYLRYLLDRYKDVRVAVAAYHAGPGRVDRWRPALATADPELWVERIPIAATRRYVQNVYRSYSFYRWLYGRDTAAR